MAPLRYTSVPYFRPIANRPLFTHVIASGLCQKLDFSGIHPKSLASLGLLWNLNLACDEGYTTDLQWYIPRPIIRKCHRGRKIVYQFSKKGELSELCWRLEKSRKAISLKLNNAPTSISTSNYWAKKGRTTHDQQKNRLEKILQYLLICFWYSH